jgi:coenzyme F420-reducing hydrogenase gamma subunit
MKSENGQKPRIAIFKLASCDGCQLTLLDAEEELLGVLEAVDIGWFPEATPRVLKPPYDIGLVEGSITTHHDAEYIHLVRRQCRILIAMGACATAGGIQALRNFQELGATLRKVYTTPASISALKMSTPIADHVPVDFELRGCPISKAQLLEVLSAILTGRQPNIPTGSVCMDCKRRGNTCVLVARGTPCIGPATQAGCGGICPAWGRGCYGCFGPMESANTAALRDRLVELGQSNAEITRTFRRFNAWTWPFREISEKAERGAAEAGK